MQALRRIRTNIETSFGAHPLVTVGDAERLVSLVKHGPTFELVLQGRMRCFERPVALFAPRKEEQDLGQADDACLTELDRLVYHENGEQGT